MLRTVAEIAEQYERLKDHRTPAPPSVSLQAWVDDVGVLLSKLKWSENMSTALFIEYMKKEAAEAQNSTRIRGDTCEKSK